MGCSLGDSTDHHRERSMVAAGAILWLIWQLKREASGHHRCIQEAERDGQEVGLSCNPQGPPSGDALPQVLHLPKALILILKTGPQLASLSLWGWGRSKPLFSFPFLSPPLSPSRSSPSSFPVPLSWPVFP